MSSGISKNLLFFKQKKSISLARNLELIYETKLLFKLVNYK